MGCLRFGLFNKIAMYANTRFFFFYLVRVDSINYAGERLNRPGYKLVKA